MSQSAYFIPLEVGIDSCPYDFLHANGSATIDLENFDLEDFGYMCNLMCDQDHQGSETFIPFFNLIVLYIICHNIWRL